MDVAGPPMHQVSLPPVSDLQQARQTQRFNPQPLNGQDRVAPHRPLSLTPTSDQLTQASPQSEIHGDDEGDGSSQVSPKQNRLRKACDSCSLRKVKCDAQQPCRACRSLDIPCTFQRPTRRRGPPNRLAESIKKAHRESHNLTSPYTTPSPTRSAPDVPPPTSSQQLLSVASICPIELVHLLVDDYFLYVHPLQPFPHEPSYRKALADRKDLYDGPFLALTASMIGALVALFPRRPRRRLRDLGIDNLFATSTDFVRHCKKVIREARGAGYLERDDLNAYDAATSYCLLSMSSATREWQQGLLYVGECYTITRALLSRSSNDFQTLPGAEYSKHGSDDSGSVDFIEREILRRMYWIVFVTIRSITPFGASFGGLYIRPPTPSQGHPPLPAEVDDQYIHHTHIGAQPRHILSKMTAFNVNCHIYLIHDPLLAMEDSYSINHVFDGERQKSVLRDCVDRVKRCFDGLSEQLLVWPGPPSRSSSSGASTEWDRPFSPGSAHSEAPGRHHFTAYEIQKANIHASYLSSRSYFVEKYWDLVSARGMDPHTEAEIRRERQSIADDLLKVLSSIRPVHMEPNSVSFHMKIRQIASTLLPSARSGPADDAGGLPGEGLSAYYLRSFLEILMELEKYQNNDANGDDDPSTNDNGAVDVLDEGDDDQEESRTWASLRQRQREFVKKNES